MRPHQAGFARHEHFQSGSDLCCHAAEREPPPVLLLNRANLLMRRASVTLLLLGCIPGAAVVMDRVAVIVGRNVVKTSDITRDLRATQFINGEPVDTSEAARRKSADRLVDQQLIRQELLNAGYTQPG